MDRIIGGLREQRMASENMGHFDGAAGSDHSFDANDAFDAKVMGDRRVRRHHAVDDFTFGFGCFLLGKTRSGENHERGSQEQEDNDGSPHVHDSSRVAAKRDGSKMTMVTLRDYYFRAGQASGVRVEGKFSPKAQRLTPRALLDGLQTRKVSST